MKKVLVLDDNSDILDVVEEALTYEQFTVKAISLGSDLIDVALTFLPDIIMLDYRLSDGNGGELCREVKSHPLLRHIPVILFSAYLFKHIDSEQLGCDDIILKPFDLEVLVGKVNELLTSKIDARD
jgi:two-component system response regulator VicR